MHKTGQDLLNLMFRSGETVCVSNNRYGYHSIPLENALNGDSTLVSPNPDYPIQKVPSDSLTLVALNPIKGWRDDASVTAYRNFLVEMDYGLMSAQMEYAKKIELPYSAVVFSGSKSLHFLISLDQDLPSYEVYYTLAEWILKIASAADQNTKNPSRSIRIPGAEREPGKMQLLVEMKGVTSLKDLAVWLAKHPDAKPKEPEKRTISDHADFSKVKPWVKQRLVKGIVGAKQGRNKEWFAIAVEFAIAGYSEDDALDLLSEYFNPDRDFKEREWKTSIHSGFKYAYTRKE